MLLRQEDRDTLKVVLRDTSRSSENRSDSFHQIPPGIEMKASEKWISWIRSAFDNPRFSKWSGSIRFVENCEVNMISRIMSVEWVFWFMNMFDNSRFFKYSKSTRSTMKCGDCVGDWIFGSESELSRTSISLCESNILNRSRIQSIFLVVEEYSLVQMSHLKIRIKSKWIWLILRTNVASQFRHKYPQQRLSSNETETSQIICDKSEFRY